jgi:hypothetical protein
MCDTDTMQGSNASNRKGEQLADSGQMILGSMQYKSVLQVIFRGTFWIRSWAVLSNEDGRSVLKAGCRNMEIVALEIFHKFGWNALKRIES